MLWFCDSNLLCTPSLLAGGVRQRKGLDAVYVLLSGN